MTAHHDLDQQLTALLRDGPTELPDASFDAVRDRTDKTRQRVVIGPWRVLPVSKLVPIGLGAATVIAVLFIGSRFIGSPGSNVGGAPSAEPTPPPTPQIGGTVEFQVDGVPATTVVTAIADGTSVTGTAVTTFSAETHTVRLECAVRQGDRWAFVGTTEQTTVPDEGAGAWSAVLVEDGTPQQIGIVFSIEKLPGDDCDAKWGTISMADMDISNPVESGELVPPPDLAP